MLSEAWKKFRGTSRPSFLLEEHGIDLVRAIPGYQDEPLQGKLKGSVRSVRMALGYRAYYRVIGTVAQCVLVEEVNRHDYKEIERLFGL